MLMTPGEIVCRAVQAEAPHCGIYFLIRQGEIVYVGQSIEIEVRIQTHRKNGKVFDSYAYVECEPEKLTELEVEYIVSLRPADNVTLPSNPKWAGLATILRKAKSNGNGTHVVRRYIREKLITSSSDFYLLSDFSTLLENSHVD